jgi:hypothetical protein
MAMKMYACYYAIILYRWANKNKILIVAISDRWEKV